MYNLTMTILYYTSNLLGKNLLFRTLSEAIQHSKDNNCQLIITSHFPLTDKYEEVDMQ